MLRQARQRRDVVEGVEIALHSDILFRQKGTDLLHSLFVASTAFVRLTPKRSNSCGRNARAIPTSSRPPDIASSIPISPASFSGLLNAGRTAPVTSRAFFVRCEAAVRKTMGLGL